MEEVEFLEIGEAVVFCFSLVILFIRKIEPKHKTLAYNKLTIIFSLSCAYGILEVILNLIYKANSPTFIEALALALHFLYLILFYKKSNYVIGWIWGTPIIFIIQPIDIIFSDEKFNSIVAFLIGVLVLICLTYYLVVFTYLKRMFKYKLHQ